MSDVLTKLHDWLLLGGQIVRARPGHAFKVVEVKKQMTDEELRQVGQPGWGKNR